MFFRLRENGDVLTRNQLRLHLEEFDTHLGESLSQYDYDTFGFDPVTAVDPPSTTSLQRALRTVEQQSDGSWAQVWTVSDISTEEAQVVRDEKWEEIKAERELRKKGGVQVGAFWFHTDVDSRIQWLGLKDSARDMLATGASTADFIPLGSLPQISWKTLSGTFTTVTVQLALDVVAATKLLDGIAFGVAETHRAAMIASSDPASYDFSANWPVIYGE